MKNIKEIHATRPGVNLTFSKKFKMKSMKIFQYLLELEQMINYEKLKQRGL